MKYTFANLEGVSLSVYEKDGLLVTARTFQPDAIPYVLGVPERAKRIGIHPSMIIMDDADPDASYAGGALKVEAGPGGGCEINGIELSAHERMDLAHQLISGYPEEK